MCFDLKLILKQSFRLLEGLQDQRISPMLSPYQYRQYRIRNDKETLLKGFHGRRIGPTQSPYQYNQ
jgi:hypothetical protein